MSNMSLGLGAMSPETIHAVFRYSEQHAQELMLISSKSQIDYAGGYVYGWTTRQYVRFLEQMRRCYPRARVKICRDHCGPGFNGMHDLEDCYQTIRTDLECGFDLIHIDFCHYQSDRRALWEQSRRAIALCLELNPSVALEIGTDDNVGASLPWSELARVADELDYFLGFCQPVYYVVQTGSLTKELRQVGHYNREFVEAVAALLHSRGVKLKEHNADYLSAADIAQRLGHVDAMNIAPQLGVVQTSILLNRCLLYGLDASAYLHRCYMGGKWRKWLHEAQPEDRLLCALIAGHYHFASAECKRLMEELGRHEDIEEIIITEVSKVIHHYLEPQGKH